MIIVRVDDGIISPRQVARMLRSATEWHKLHKIEDNFHFILKPENGYWFLDEALIFPVADSFTQRSIA